MTNNNYNNMTDGMDSNPLAPVCDPITACVASYSAGFLGFPAWYTLGALTLDIPADVPTSSQFYPYSDAVPCFEQLAGTDFYDAYQTFDPDKADDFEETGKKTKWNVSKFTQCIWLKFYAEQVGYVPEGQTEIQASDVNTIDQIAHLLAFLKRLDAGKHLFFYHAILHDKDDLQADEADVKRFWTPDIEKPHIHLLIWFKDKKDHIRISTLLNYLQKETGLYYRKDEDTNMFYTGTKFPDMRSKAHLRCIVYHTHESDEARREDGKYPYSRDEVHTNIAPEYIDLAYELYQEQLSDVKMVTPEKLDLCKVARKLGRSGRSFDDWYYTDIPTKWRSKALKDRLNDEYQRGIVEFLNSTEAKHNCRCSIFIQGDGNLGKTYTSKLVFEIMGLKAYVVEAGGTGKMDDLDSTYQAMVVSDTGIKDLLGMADNDYCKVYRRNNSNPVWAGKYLIITYNAPLWQYVETYTRIQDPKAKEALYSRFYQCRVTRDKGLVCHTPQSRGDAQTRTEHNRMFYQFATLFNQEFFRYFSKSKIDIPTDEQFKNECGEFYDPTARVTQNMNNPTGAYYPTTSADPYFHAKQQGII